MKPKADSRKAKGKKPATEDQAAARTAAIQILTELHGENKPVDLYFNRFTRSLSAKDRNFTKTLVFGVLRQMEYLDHILSRFSRHPLSKMKTRTKVALEIGIFQLLLLDRIPPPAAIHATVEALKSTRQPSWLIGFVNGILRNVSRQAKTLPGPHTAKINNQPILNHPKWLTDRWKKQFGQDLAEDICRVNNLEPTLTVRVNTTLTSRRDLLTAFTERGIEATPCRHSPVGIGLEGLSESLVELPGFSKGLFQVQDESAQLASYLLSPFSQDDRILDACAGLGGKTGHLAELSPVACKIVAVEPNSRRQALMRENLERLGLAGRVEQYQGTLEHYAATKPSSFDAILLDAPCSGTGIIRRQPDIRWHRTREGFHDYRRVQLELLAAAAGLLKTGGRLVYAVCSIEPEEGPEVIDLFLEQHPGYHLEHAGNLLPETALELIDERGFFRPLPTIEHDGFFGAVLSRSSGL